MSGMNKPPTLIPFGPFEADCLSQELRKHGVRLRLPRQSFQILKMLLERPGEVVTREELRARLWSADTFVDFDHGLNAAVKRLRDALGDSTESPRFIETVPRLGYRFVAPGSGGIPAEARIADGPTVLSAPTLSAIAARERGKAFFRQYGIVILLSLIVLGVLGWEAWRSSLHTTNVVERKLTANSSENNVTSAAITRDGKYLAYSDNTGLYLKLIRSGETHPVPLPPNFTAGVSDWFPDGSHLLVWRGDPPEKLSLWTIPIFGGTPRKLAEDAWGGAISPDGSHIAFQRSDFGREEWVMRADGTEQVKAASDKSSWAGPPTWSPDGNRIAYTRLLATYSAREGSIEINEWRNSKVRVLFSENRLGPSLRWLPNGLLVYTLGDEENQQGASLWTISPERSGKAGSASSKRITQGIGWISQVTGSDDGRALTFLRENMSISIYIAKMAADGTHLLENKRLTFDENQNDPFAWTPDSKAILFHSNRNGTSEIFKQSVDQSLPEFVVTSAEQLQQPRVSPDGSEILYISTPKSAAPGTLSSILAVPISGGPPRLVLRAPNIWNIQCPSPPSAFCMYSAIQGDTSQTFLFDVKTGKTLDPPQVDPICNWSLSPDGSQRAIVCAHLKGTIRLLSTRTDERRELAVKGWDALHSIVWSADGQTLFVAGHNQSDTALLNVAMNGEVSVLLRSSNPQILGAIPSPDGRCLAIAGTSGSRNVWQIENF